MLRALRVAFGFLTTLPVPIVKDWRDNDLRLAVKVYPIVGLSIGLFLLVVVWLTKGLEPLLSAALIMTAWLAITGGLHFDGFCDMADAALAPKLVQERWRIAKDPQIGSFALMAGALLVLLKVSAIVGLLTNNAFIFLLLSPILARTVVVWVMAYYSVHDSSLLGRQSNLTWTEIVLPLGVGLILSGVISSFSLHILQVLFVLLSLAVSIYLLASFLNQKMQGLGGDAYGAVIEVSEMMVLVTANFLV
jgi:adenosylcobinamide-GDP ribazoletransferase